VPHLDVSDDALASCVGCGLCLPHCPTFRVSGDEALSPRGRIEIMRALHDDRLDFDDEVVRALDTCIQCRGCEPACPSGVPYGQLIDAAHRAHRERVGPPVWWLRIGLQMLTRRRLIATVSRVVGALQRVRLAPRRLGRLPVRLGPRVRDSSTVGASPDVWILTGCVMDAWFRPVHRALTEILDRFDTTWSAPSPGHCCGALHSHAGWRAEAIRRAEHTMSLFPGDRPILVDSAGCGAAMKDYGHLLDTDAARQFSSRVVDVHEWLAPRLSDLGVVTTVPTRHELSRVVLQDPCHLRHVQRAHLHVRACLTPFVDVVELDDDGVCCGAGGAYSLLQPDLASRVRDRKLEAIRRVDPTDTLPIASANPGCAQHLAATGRTVVHPIEIVASALRFAEIRRSIHERSS
jgi:glycolate oxidase iron-sulfur subunit